MWTSSQSVFLGAENQMANGQCASCEKSHLGQEMQSGNNGHLGHLGMHFQTHLIVRLNSIIQFFIFD